MRFIRRLLLYLTLAIALFAILALAALVPAAQTLVAQMFLPHQPGRQISLGSLSVGLSGVEVVDLRLDVSGAVLSLPSLAASLPLKTALWDRKLVIRSMAAKGWTLDLSRQSTPVKSEARAPVAVPHDSDRIAPVSRKPAPAEQVVRAIRGILSDWTLPCDASFDGVELEGNVILSVPSEPEPVRVHVILQGGGLAADHLGDFAIEATGTVADPSLPLRAATARGRLVLAMGASRTINRVEFKGGLFAEHGSLPEDLMLSASIAAPRDAKEETYAIDFSRGDRHLAIFRAVYPNATGRLEATWKVDLRDSDLTPLFQDHPLPAFVATGEGRFDADTSFAGIHVVGDLNVASSHLGAISPEWDRLGNVTLDTGFDLVRRGGTIRFDRLNVAVEGPQPIAVVRSLQTFSFDEKTSALKPGDPRADWLACSLQRLPLAWLSNLAGGLVFSGGDAAGEFVVRTTDDGFALSPKTPLTATGVKVQRADRLLAQGLDLSALLRADYSSQGWQVEWAPVKVSSAGQRLATIEAKASGPTQSDGQVKISGTWNADLGVLASRQVIPAAEGIKGRSASGDFSVRPGSTTEVQAKVNVVGHDAGHSLAASVQGYVGPHGTASFRIPVRISLGPKVAEFTADGRSSNGQAGPRWDVELTGVKVALEPFGLLAASLPALSGGSWPAILAAASGGSSAPVGARDQRPFWADWVGRVSIDFYELGWGSHELNEVAGAFNVDHGSIRLEGGRGTLVVPEPTSANRARSWKKEEASPNQVKAEGSLTFDAAAEFPYSLQATATLDTVDAARLFGARDAGRDPMVEGHFTVAGTLTGQGLNLADLVDRRREEYRLESSSAIVRFLKANVAASITEAPSKVPDALVAASSVVGAFLGVKGGSLYSGKNPLSKNTEAVLDFTSQIAEIGFEKATVTAIRGSDYTIHLIDLTLSSPNERLTGTGQIAYVKDQPLAAWPLNLDLRLGVRGRKAELLSIAGLRDSDKDPQGFWWLNQTIHLGGTLREIDGSQWHDLLLKAATKAPNSGKKSG